MYSVNENNNRPKILCVIEDLGSGGAQKQLVNIGIFLKKNNKDVSFLCYYNSPFYQETLFANGIECVCINNKGKIGRILAFRKYIRTGKFNAIIAFLPTAVFLCELTSIPFRNWKLIISERSSNPAILTSIKSISIRLLHFLANHVICNSYSNEVLLKKINPFIPKKKVDVIYNGIDIIKYAPPTKHVYKKNGKVIIVVPASYRRLKNIIGLLKAIEMLDYDVQQMLEIHWYGDIDDLTHADNVYVEALEYISMNKLHTIMFMHGAVKNIDEKMQAADAIGIFSFFEGLPNSICEGMACGKPIISSNVSDIPLIIEEDINGFLCNANQIDSISNALKKLVNTPKETLEKMGIINRRKAEILFDENIVYNKYLNLTASEN